MENTNKTPQQNNNLSTSQKNKGNNDSQPQPIVNNNPNSTNNQNTPQYNQNSGQQPQNNKKKTCIIIAVVGCIGLSVLITILAVLAGLTIGVLNPVQQQNRAKDAMTTSSINKLALSAKSLTASSPRMTNKSPTPQEFREVDASISNDTCTSNSPTQISQCTFEVEGIEDTIFTYYRGPNVFRIAAPSKAESNKMFVYEYDPQYRGIENIMVCSALSELSLSTNASLESLGCEELN